MTDDEKTNRERDEAIDDVYGYIVWMTASRSRQYVGQEDVDNTLEKMLSFAQETPLHDQVMFGIELLFGKMHLPGYHLRFNAPDIEFEKGYSALRVALAHYHENPGFLLYSLPELRRFDGDLLPLPYDEDRRSFRSTWLGVTVPTRIDFPAEEPRSDGSLGYEWREPAVGYEDGVLSIEQKSRYRDPDGSKSYETSYLSVYRIFGSTFHVRTARLYWVD